MPQLPFRSGLAHRNCSRFAPAVVFAVLAAALSAQQAPSPTQESSLNAAASQIAHALIRAHQKKVVVFHFYNSDDRLTALGDSLADQFSAALSRNKRVHVQGRSQLDQLVSKIGYNPIVLARRVYEPMLAHNLGAKAYVDGTINPDGSYLSVVVSSWASEKSKSFGRASFSLPLSSENASLFALTVAAAPIFPYLDSHEKSFRPPKCISCPRPEYSAAAMQAKAQGTVILDAVVTPGGRTRAITVIKAMPYGLTARALQAVHGWKLSPAVGPDGKRLAVRQIFELQFTVF